MYHLTWTSCGGKFWSDVWLPKWGHTEH